MKSVATMSMVIASGFQKDSKMLEDRPLPDAEEAAIALSILNRLPCPTTKSQAQALLSAFENSDFLIPDWYMEQLLSISGAATSG